MNNDYGKYGITDNDAADKVQRILDRDRDYQKLLQKYAQAQARGQYVQQISLHQQIEAKQYAVCQMVVGQEFDRRMSVSHILTMLHGKDEEDYRDLMNALSFCLDAIDFIFLDINALLHRCHIGVLMENFDEVRQCRALAQKLVNDDLQRMQQSQQDIYTAESANIYSTIRTRAGVYRRKCVRNEEKQKKLTEKTKTQQK